MRSNQQLQPARLIPSERPSRRARPPQQLPPRKPQVKRNSLVSRRRVTELSLLLFMLPALIVVTIFVIVPTVWAIIVSFTNQSLIGPSAQNPEFIGIANYARLIRDEQFWNSLEISFLFVLFSALIGQFFIGLALAVLLRKANVVVRGFIGGSVLLAWVVPEIVAAYIWASMFSARAGAVNQLLIAAGFTGIRWLIDTPLLAIIIANIWRGTAFSMLLFSSALETIPGEVIDAAEVDGASSWQRFRLITVPMIRYTILLDIILLTMGTFAVFGLVYALTNGGPLFRSEVMGVYIYRNAFQFRDIGYGSAASTVMLVINLVLALFYLRFLRVDINE